MIPTIYEVYSKVVLVYVALELLSQFRRLRDGRAL